MKTSTLVCFALFAVSGCANESKPDTGPEGPVAENATEAWPTQPNDLAVLSSEELLEACATAGSCSPEVAALPAEARIGLIDLCLHDAVFSAERAIPLTGWNQSNERVEFWTSCVLGANDCATVEACRTARNESITCQEDGCRASVELDVSCNGAIATLTADGKSTTRDCSRAFAECDANSPTGCTDRHYSVCPDDIDTHDRCDGNVRLGCDGAGQVSFHDCTRLGGACGLAADGTQDCVYPGPISLECEASEAASCTGSTLSACVNGRRISIESSFCSG